MRPLPPRFAALNISDKYIASTRATNKPCDYEAIASVVKAIDPNQGRCIITNTSDDIQLHHVLPRTLMENDDFMDSMEWSWNLRRGDLNLDTPFNVLPVSLSVKKKLESCEWLLVPDNLTATHLHISVFLARDESLTQRRHRFPKLEGKTFEYTLFPVSALADAKISRRKIPDDPNSATVYQHPYTGFPTVVSHVRPEYVLAAIGYHIMAGTNSALRAACIDHPILYMVPGIYGHWVTHVRCEANNDESFFPDLSRSVADFSAGTQVGRIFMVNPKYVSPPPSLDESLSSSETESQDSFVDDNASYETPPRRLKRARTSNEEESKKLKLDDLTDPDGGLYKNESSMKDWANKVPCGCNVPSKVIEGDE